MICVCNCSLTHWFGPKPTHHEAGKYFRRGYQEQFTPLKRSQSGYARLTHSYPTKTKEH